jgi:hypothetical protein
MDIETISVEALVPVLAELETNLAKSDREQIRQLYLATCGIEFSVDSRHRPQGPTIPACRKVGSEVKRKLGYGPMYGMSVVGYAVGHRWFMQPSMRDAIATLGWFDDSPVESEARAPDTGNATWSAASCVPTKRMLRSWILQQAKGRCECCRKLAPFSDVKGAPFLEVHHIQRLADGGEDLPENAVALCPNCHRELHYGKRAAELISKMRLRIKRLAK